MNIILNRNTVLKENDFISPGIGEVDYLLDTVIKDCSKKYFHSFEYRCVYDKKFTNLS